MPNRKGKNQKITESHKKSGHKPPSRAGTKWSEEQREKFMLSVGLNQGKGWVSLRKQVLKRDKNTCNQCGLIDEEIMVVDHIKPKSIYPELKLEITNLQTLCPNCHARKTIKEVMEIIRIKETKL